MITKADVDRAYEAAFACLEPLKALREAAEALKEHLRQHEDEDPPENMLKALASALPDFCKTVEAAEAELKPVKEMLDLCSLGRVDVQCNQAASYLAAFVAYMREKVDFAERLVGGDIESPRTDFHNLHNVGGWSDGRIGAEFDIERARVKARVREEAGLGFDDEEGLWRLVGGRIELLGKLGELRKRSHKLMQYFIQRQRRVVTYRDLEVDIWDGVCRKGTIQEAVRKLRADLDDLGLGAIKDRLRTEEDGYLFE